MLVNTMYSKRLIELRESKNLKQYEVADLLEIYKGTYNQYETEYTIMPLKHLINLCDYFNVSLDYIFSFTDNKQFKKSEKQYKKELLGERLKKFRKDNKLTQERLADILNTTHSVIADYERGRYLISTSFLYEICKRYNISADYLLGRIS